MIVSAMMSRCDRKETRTRTQGTPAQTRDHNISSGGLQHRYRIILTDNHFHYGAINRNMCATKDHFHRDDTPCASPRANLGSTDRGPPPPSSRSGAGAAARLGDVAHVLVGGLSPRRGEEAQLCEVVGGVRAAERTGRLLYYTILD